MKRYLAKISICIILFSIIFETHYFSFASTEENITIKMASSTSILSENFTDDWNPQNEQNDVVETLSKPFTTTIVEVVNAVLGIVQVIGILILVVSIAMFGLGMIIKTDAPLAHDLGLDTRFPMMGGDRDAPGNVRDMLNYGRSLLIGAVLLLASSTIVKIVLNVLFL